MGNAVAASASEWAGHVSSFGFRVSGSAGSRRPVRAFTLIEVLVVIGVMVLVLGGVGVALSGRGGEGAALTNSQNIVAGMVAAARAQAALHQTNARLVIYYQQPPGGDAEKYLRSLVVVREEPYLSRRYTAAGEPVTLPVPICIVPPAPVPTTHLQAGVVWDNRPTGPTSTLQIATGFNYGGQNQNSVRQFFGTQGQSGRILYLEFAPDGTVTSTSSAATKIAVSTAELRGAALPRLTNASAVRGLFVRRSGGVSLVDQSTGF